MADRDAKGRLLPGHSIQPPPGHNGRHKLDDSERIRTIARNVLDEETIAAWTKAMRKKLAKGNSFATEYIRDTLAGKPAVNANVTVSSELEAFMMAWRSLQGPTQPAPDALPTADDGPRLLEPPTQVDDSPSETEDS